VERRFALPVWIYAAMAVWILVPLSRAHFAYDAARQQPSRAAAVPFLEGAMRLDPGFPLYRARWAWAATEPPAELRAAEAIGAARSARGVAALWLRAGIEALEAERKDLAAEAFGRALALDPLSAFAPFQLAPLVADPAACAARAFAAEPRLLAATFFRGGEAARLTAIRRLEAITEIDPGWRAGVAAAGRGVRIEGDDTADLVAAIDGSPALSLSLHAFRRSAWPADLARLSVDRSAVRELRSLPAATALPDSRPAAFPPDRCLP
jgi:tetratricopeptide (TPR) repeat protein